jgi:hypothetical protein
MIVDVSVMLLVSVLACGNKTAPDRSLGLYNGSIRHGTHHESARLFSVGGCDFPKAARSFPLCGGAVVPILGA